VATGGVVPGNVVVQVGPAPVEGAAVLAQEAAGRLGGMDTTMLAAAGAAFDRPGISVVEPALLAARLGATALHDPTEGGLAAGLHELADASGVRIRIDRRAVLWFEPGLAVCRALGADPWSTLASGTLLAAFPAATVEVALQASPSRGTRQPRSGRPNRARACAMLPAARSPGASATRWTESCSSRSSTVPRRPAAVVAAAARAPSLTM